MHIIFDITLITIRLADIILHSVGIYLLTSSKGFDKESSLRILLLNLSITEILGSLLWLFMIPISRLYPSVAHMPTILINIKRYAMICLYSLVAILFYATIIYIALNAFLDTRTTVKYRISWHSKRTKFLITATWIFGILLFTCMLVVYHVTGYEFDLSFRMYFYTPLNFTFIFIVLCMFLCVFLRYRKKHNQKCCRQQKTRHNRRIVFSTIVQSPFSLPILLSMTFIVFTILPDLTSFFLIWKRRYTSEILQSICALLYAVSNFFDVVLYIYLLPKVRHDFLKKCNLGKKGRYKISRSFWTNDLQTHAAYWITGKDNVNIIMNGPEKLV